MHLKLGTMAAVLLTGTLAYASDEAPLKVNVESARNGAKVVVKIQNEQSHAIHIWEAQGSSVGWSSWTFEFFTQNEMTVFVRKPDATFRLDEPRPLAIPASASIEQTFFLDDGSWVAHHLPTFPKHVPNGTAFTNKCLAILSIPETDESKKKGVWAGIATSQAFGIAQPTFVSSFTNTPKTGSDQFADIDTQKLLDTVTVTVHWNSMDVAACLDDLAEKSKEADPAHVGLKFSLQVPPDTGSPTSPTSKILRTVSILLDDVPISNVLGYVAVQTNTQYVVRKGEVIFLPSDVKIDPATGLWPNKT